MYSVVEVVCKVSVWWFAQVFEEVVVAVAESALEVAFGMWDAEWWIECRQDFGFRDSTPPAL